MLQLLLALVGQASPEAGAGEELLEVPGLQPRRPPPGRLLSSTPLGSLLELPSLVLAPPMHAAFESPMRLRARHLPIP